MFMCLMTSTSIRTRKFIALKNRSSSNDREIEQQWHQSQRRDRRKGTSKHDRKLHNIQNKKLQSFKQRMELASLLQNLDISGEINKTRNMKSTYYTYVCIDQENESDSKNNGKNYQPSNENELSTGTIQDKLEIEGKFVPLSIETFDDFISIMVNRDRIYYKNKEFFKMKIEKATSWFHKMKNGEDLALPPKVADLDICLLEFYRFVIKSGGLEAILRENEWSEMAMSFGYPECYGQAFSDLFDQYLLILQEHYEFGLKRYERISSTVEQDIGGVTNKLVSGNVGSEGGIARSRIMMVRTLQVLGKQIKSKHQIARRRKIQALWTIIRMQA
ncbi:ARID DNA-binding domain-containing protein [Tanacetum coccineum]